MTPRTRILLVGGGYVGMYAALELQKRAGRRADVTVVNPENFMLYQPFLPEVASGNIEPRHVVVPLRQVLRHARIVVGEVTQIAHDHRTATVRTGDGETFELGYDVIVMGAGSRSRVLPVPGLAERGIGFKSVAEAIYLRNHVIGRLDEAAETPDPERRRAALSFVFVGGGYAGVEALAELEDMAGAAMKYYPQLRRVDMRWVLVEAAGTILPEIGPDLAAYVRRHLEERGIAVMLGTRLESADGGVMKLSNGASFAADTLVWTAGVKPEQVAERSGFPVDDRGRVVVDAYLRVRGIEGAWAAGDDAAVPDLLTGATAPPTAQHALREARRLGRNIAATLTGGPLEPFRHRNLGQLASLGRFKGAATVLGVRVTGFPAWWLHRSYHILMMPTLSRKSRIVADWTVGLVFPRDIAQLGSIHNPRQPFERAASGDESLED
ncbi:MAG TPA: NAD(P)/FAD-dependent oxidoreductase [Actinomycetota bacterium]|nr:NAD(P)/FAD-dependent oxidoreductase [Actinomycetota bacterium]